MAQEAALPSIWGACQTESNRDSERMSPAWHPAHTFACRFLCHRWVQRTQQLKRMGLSSHLERHLSLGMPDDFMDFLMGGPAWLRLGLLETLPIGALAGRLAELTAHWRCWDQEAWGRCLPLLVRVDPKAAIDEIDLAMGSSDGLPRGSGVPGMVTALSALGTQGRPAAQAWAGHARLSGVPLEYLWSGWFGMLASNEAPGLAQMLLHTFQVFAPGAREVDVVIRSIFDALIPGSPALGLVLGMRTGAGYLMEDLPELYVPSSLTRKVDGLLVASPPCDSSAVIPLLQAVQGRLPGPSRLALQLVRLSSLGRWSTHAGRLADFALAVVAAACERLEPQTEELPMEDLLSLLAVDLGALRDERHLISSAANRMEARHADLLERELVQAGNSQGLVRLIQVARRQRAFKVNPWMISILGRQSQREASWLAAGALVEAGPCVVPDLERSYDGLGFEGKALVLDVVGLLPCSESGACLSRKLRGALSDTELLDRWALAASWLGHQDLMTAAKRWAGCAPWPLQAAVDLSGW